VPFPKTKRQRLCKQVANTLRLTSTGWTRWQPAKLSVSEAQASLCMPYGSQLWVNPAWVITLIRNLLTSACTRAVNNLPFLSRSFYKSKDPLTIPSYFPIMTIFLARTQMNFTQLIKFIINTVQFI